MTISTALKAATALAFVLAFGATVQAQDTPAKTRQIVVEAKADAAAPADAKADAAPAQAKQGQPADVTGAVDKIADAKPVEVQKAPEVIAKPEQKVVVNPPVVVEKPQQHSTGYSYHGYTPSYHGSYGYHASYGYDHCND